MVFQFLTPKPSLQDNKMKGRMKGIEIAGNQTVDLSDVDSLTSLMHMKAMPIRGIAFNDGESSDTYSDEPSPGSTEGREEALAETLARMKKEKSLKNSLRKRLSSFQSGSDLRKLSSKTSSTQQQTGSTNASFKRSASTSIFRNGKTSSSLGKDEGISGASLLRMKRNESMTGSLRKSFQSGSDLLKLLGVKKSNKKGLQHSNSQDEYTSSSGNKVNATFKRSSASSTGSKSRSKAMLPLATIPAESTLSGAGKARPLFPQDSAASPLFPQDVVTEKETVNATFKRPTTIIEAPAMPDFKRSYTIGSGLSRTKAERSLDSTPPPGSPLSIFHGRGLSAKTKPPPSLETEKTTVNATFKPTIPVARTSSDNVNFKRYATVGNSLSQTTKATPLATLPAHSPPSIPGTSLLLKARPPLASKAGRSLPTANAIFPGSPSSSANAIFKPSAAVGSVGTANAIFQRSVAIGSPTSARSNANATFQRSTANATFPRSTEINSPTALRNAANVILARSNGLGGPTATRSSANATFNLSPPLGRPTSLRSSANAAFNQSPPLGDASAAVGPNANATFKRSAPLSTLAAAPVVPTANVPFKRSATVGSSLSRTKVTPSLASIPADSPLALPLAVTSIMQKTKSPVPQQPESSTGRVPIKRSATMGSSLSRPEAAATPSTRKKNFLWMKSRGQSKSQATPLKRSATIGGSLSSKSKSLATIPADGPLNGLSLEVKAPFTAESDASSVVTDDYDANGKKNFEFKKHRAKRRKSLTTKIRASFSFGQRKSSDFEKKFDAASFFGVCDTTTELSDSSPSPSDQDDPAAVKKVVQMEDQQIAQVARKQLLQVADNVVQVEEQQTVEVEEEQTAQQNEDKQLDQVEHKQDDGEEVKQVDQGKDKQDGDDHQNEAKSDSVCDFSDDSVNDIKSCLKVKSLQESLQKCRGTDAPNLVPGCRDDVSVGSRRRPSLTGFMVEVKGDNNKANGSNRTQTMTDSERSAMKEDKLRWGNIQIREYGQCLGDNPACSDGAAIQLDWDYQLIGVQHLDKYESGRSIAEAKETQNGDDSSLRIPATYRQFLLLGMGYTPHQLSSAVRLKQRDQKRRIQTLARLKYQKIDAKMEKLAQMFPNKGKPLPPVEAAY